jgi:hypothetical protein
MAITITATGEVVVLDETDDLQNATTTPSVSGDADDNDTALALPSQFETRLQSVLGVSDLSTVLLESALSGHDGSNGDTGQNVVTISGALTNLALSPTDSGGSFPAYSGTNTSTFDSGLQTLDETPIFLFADPEDDNIVYGVKGDSADGDVVFAIYLEETDAGSDGSIDGAKMWTVLTEPLLHGDDTDPDDSVDLTDKLFVSADQRIELSASEAPSGNNLFIMFGGETDSTKAVVATGMQPANQSDGANVSSGDTIVTSQVTDTTFGTNSQMIKPPSKQDTNGNGIWFTYVTDPVSNFTVPDLSPTEANLEANIQYDKFFGVDEASFDVVQLQGGKSAVVKITAVDSPHDGTAEDGAKYVDGVLDDFSKLNTVAIDITDVTLSGALSGSFARSDGNQTVDGLSVTWNPDGSVTLGGVLAGTHIDYVSDGLHERVLIQNAGSGSGNASASFDIGGFTIESTATDATEIGSKVQFEDDGPTIAVENASGNFDDGAQGKWTNDPGTDGFDSLTMTLDSYKIDGDAAVTVDTTLTGAVDNDGNFVFTGSITDDFNGDGKDETVDFTLTLDPNKGTDGTYDLQLTTPPPTVTVFDTSQGSLKAGGPDAVQTLQFPPAGHDGDVVFFAVAPTVPLSGKAGDPPPNDIQDLVKNDPTETDLEANNGGLITLSTQLNVSTSGIGVNNNNLDSSDAKGQTTVFAGTSITSSDESFVVNPEDDVDRVRVFIDNAVGGYTPATEDLYYVAYFTDGTVSGPTEVKAGDLQPVGEDDPISKGTVFEIDGGTKQIEAVQLIMGQGTVKIPVIQFVIETEFTPQPLTLNFTADLFDGDGDDHQDSFSVDLVDA